jgi:hypothetical protein
VPESLVSKYWPALLVPERSCQQIPQQFWCQKDLVSKFLSTPGFLWCQDFSGVRISLVSGFLWCQDFSGVRISLYQHFSDIRIFLDQHSPGKHSPG